VLIGESDKAMEVSQRLYDEGFYVAAIRPPTVAKGSARLRLSVQYEHSIEQIDRLVDAIVKAMA
jgi:7-keto-8-aminopelargonate synthetase-like enzyme